MHTFQRNPTVKRFPNFTASVDGHKLRKAMDGFGCDKEAIINILCARSNSQRQEIEQYFAVEFGSDLIKDLKSELGGKFEDVIVGLMMPPHQYLCMQLHKAMEDGVGNHEQTLIEILCTRPKATMKNILEEYKKSEYIT